MVPVQVIESLAKVAVDALPHHGGVEVIADVHTGAVVEQEESVEHDVKTVDRKLKLPLHSVHELEFYRVRLIVAEGNQTPAITVVHFDHFRHIGLFECTRGHPLLGGLLR